jgi:2-polyprenyl-3-methyl-5-hydroxy-6-metoxy-1,4-benzoquinol methylase
MANGLPRDTLDFLERFASYGSLLPILTAAVAADPSHVGYLRCTVGGLTDQELPLVDAVAQKVLRLVGNLDRVAQHYRWMCDIFFKEEVHFRRTGRYRLSTFAEADRDVYSNKEFMRRYMDGVLLSQVLWSNHARSMLFFLTNVIGRMVAPFTYLEVGPGHGLSAAFALENSPCRRVVGWDVSPTSVAHTVRSLHMMGAPDCFRVERRDVLQPYDGDEQYDVVVMSEVLEHLEKPGIALRNLAAAVAPGGRLYVNMPINSPAPDHIFLLRHPEQVLELVEAAGFHISCHSNFPAAGYDEAAAMARSITISCAVLAKKPEAGF